MNPIKNTRDHPGYLARALPLAVASDIPNVITPRKSLRGVLSSLALAVGAALLAGSAQAATLTWNLGGGGNWDAATANWTGAATTFLSDGSQDVIFNNTAGGAIAISASMQPNSTTVSAASGIYTFNGGAITGPGGLTKSGAGQLTMNTANNTFTGKTSIQGGTLLTGGAAYLSNAGSPGVFGSATGANATIDLYNGVTLRSDGSSPRVNQATDRPLNLAGTGAGTVTIRYNDNDAGLTFGAVTATGTGAKTLALFTGNNGSGDREAINFTGAIADSSDSSPTSLNVTFNSQSSNWVSLSAVNTFTGPITLAQTNSTASGILVIGGLRTAGNPSVNTIGTGKLGNGNYPGAITLGARTVLEYDSSTPQTLAGVISGAGALTLTGSGTVTLSGLNTYSGNTTVTSGRTLVLDTAGRLNFAVTNSSATKVTGSGTATLNGAFTIDTTGVTAFVGSWTLVDVANKTYGGNFGLTGYTQSGTVFTKVDGIKTWTFDTSSGVLSVSSKALITSFGTPGHTGVIDQGAKTITMDAPYGTDLATLTPTFVTSSGTCNQTSGSSPSPTFAVANPATYTVTDASASVTNSYSVTVTVAPLPPGGVGGGLNAWYDASVGVTTSASTVTAWKDQSGNGYHATLGAGTPQLGTSQINGRSAVFFRGGNNYLNINYNIVPQQEYIVFRSGRYAYDPGNPNLWGGDWGGPFGQQNDNGWMLESGTKKMWSDGGHLPLAVSQNGTSIVQNNANGNPYGMANVADYMILKVNPKNYGSAYGRIGRPNNSWGNGYMDVAEVIVYNRVLSSDEENAVGYYLATKYGVTTAYVAPPAPKQIASFSFPSYGVATIAGTNITMSVPGGTDLHLSPTYTYLGQSCSPASGSQQDFSVPVHYIVTATDSSTTDYTVTVSYAPWINVNIDNTARAGLVGPAGGLGDTWNTFTSVSASALLNNAGAATGVGYTSGGSSWGGPDSWGSPAIVMLTQGLRNLDVGVANSQYLTISNLPNRRYNVFIASENNSDAGASSGVWSTSNTTTTVGGQSVSDTAGVNGSTWVQGVNYVLFENVVPNGSGNITLSGHSVPTTQHSDARLPLNGFQLVDAGPVSNATLTGAATAAAFTTTYGTASAAQTFAIGGSSLTANITATAPTGFEVSSDGSSYGSTATFTRTGGSASGTLSLRLSATAAVSGSYDGQNIVLSSTGATSVNVTTAASGNSVSPAAQNYTSWASTNSMTGGPTHVGQDGLSNLLVYALNLKTNGGNGSPGTLTGHLLSFAKRADAVTNNDVTYAIQISADLGVADPWTTTTTGVTETTSAIAIDMSTMGGAKHFARLIVTQKR